MGIMKEEYEKEIFLMNVQNEINANIIKGLLETNGIPTLFRYKEAGDYLKVYMGATNFGIDIFVPESKLKEAKEIIENQPEIDESFDVQLNEEDIKKEHDFSRRQRRLFWRVFIIIEIVSLLLIIAILIMLNM